MSAPVIELYPGVQEHAFASMMAQLVQTNLADHPAKLRDFERMQGRVALVAEDADTAVTMRFQRGKLSVHAGVFGVPDVVVRGPSNVLIDLSRVPPLKQLPFLPDPRSDATRSLARSLAERRLRL